MTREKGKGEGIQKKGEIKISTVPTNIIRVTFRTRPKRSPGKPAVDPPYLSVRPESTNLRGAESPIRHKSGLLTLYLITVHRRWRGRKPISLISVQRPTINSRTASITVGTPESQFSDPDRVGGGNYFRRKGKVRHKFDSEFSQAFGRHRKRKSNCLFLILPVPVLLVQCSHSGSSVNLTTLIISSLASSTGLE